MRENRSFMRGLYFRCIARTSSLFESRMLSSFLVCQQAALPRGQWSFGRCAAAALGTSRINASRVAVRVIVCSGVCLLDVGYAKMLGDISGPLCAYSEPDHRRENMPKLAAFALVLLLPFSVSQPQGRGAFWSRLPSSGGFSVYFAPSLTSKTVDGDMVSALRITSQRPMSGEFRALEEQAHVSVACSTSRYTVHDHTARAANGEIRIMTPLVEDASFAGSSGDWIQQAIARLCRAPVARRR